MTTSTTQRVISWASMGAANAGGKLFRREFENTSFVKYANNIFNEYCEKPFRAQWVTAAPLPDPWNVEDVHWARFDYASFKLFHLSVLFRASVSSLPTFAAVSLGPHEEKLRQLLLSRNPGEHSQYPIFGHAVVHHETKHLVRMVSQTVQANFEGHRCYGTIYGGVQWWVGVSAHRNIEFERAGLQSDGQMPFDAVPWNEVMVIQSAAEALRHPRRKH